MGTRFIKQIKMVSIVVPFYNEIANVVPMFVALKDAIKSIPYNCEIIAVDDGSTDGTADELCLVQENNPWVRVVILRRNFGQTAALSAGFDYAKGDVIVALDGDLQNSPSDIPELLKKIEEGYDIVNGWRVGRVEGFLSRRFPSKVANWLLCKVSGVELHDFGCTLKAYRSEIIKDMRLYGDMHRFIPAVASNIGARIIEVPVQHFPRQHGKSKYGISRSIKVFLDLFTLKFFLGFSNKPMRLFGLVGFTLLAIGIIISLYLGFVRIVLNEGIGNRPMLTLMAILVVGGLQMVTAGLIAEIQARIYYESQHKTVYAVKDVLEFDVEEAKR
jgi:glycosyltransferase involved in cell wall biosynthesis